MVFIFHAKNGEMVGKVSVYIVFARRFRENASITFEINRIVKKDPISGKTVHRSRIGPEIFFLSGSQSIQVAFG